MRERWSSKEPRQAPGVYALYSGDELIYVGVSSDLRTRIITHRKRFGAFVKAKVSYDSEAASRQDREGRLLRRLKPSANKDLFSRASKSSTIRPTTVVSGRVTLAVRCTLENMAEAEGITLAALVARILKRSISQEERSA